MPFSFPDEQGDKWYRCMFCSNGSGIVTSLTEGQSKHHSSGHFPLITQELRQERDKAIEYYAKARKAEPDNWDHVTDRMLVMAEISAIYDGNYRADQLRKQGYKVDCLTRYTFFPDLVRRFRL